MKTNKIALLISIPLLITLLIACGGGVSQNPATASSSDGNNSQNNDGTSGTTGGTSGNGDTGGTNNPGTPNEPEVIAWSAPVTNTDGTSLTDLAGYKLYYGPSSGVYSGYVNLGDITSVSLTTLATMLPAPGTYYISLTVYNATGVESSFSNEVYITI